MFRNKEDILHQKIVQRCTRITSKGIGETLKWRLKVGMRWRVRKLCDKTKIVLIKQAKVINFDPPNSNNFMLQFNGFTTASKSLQDYFIYLIGLECGNLTFLELGAGPAIHGCNTYTLEKFHKWKGVSIELDSSLASTFRLQRINPIINADALLLNYEEILESFNLGPDIGYLQIDIDPSFQSLACLLRIPFDRYRFAGITFEHDRYRSGSKVAKAKRAVLKHYGYELLVEDLLVDNKYPYEDWWVHPALVDIKKFQNLKHKRINPIKLFSNYESYG